MRMQLGDFRVIRLGRQKTSAGLRFGFWSGLGLGLGLGLVLVLGLGFSVSVRV